MAITLTNQSPVTRSQAQIRTDTHWIVNFFSVDVTGNEVIRADPGAGQQLVLEWILLNYPFAATIELNEDDTVILGPFTMTTTSPPLFLDFRGHPYPLAISTVLQVDSSGANILTGVAKGYTIVA